MSNKRNAPGLLSIMGYGKGYLSPVIANVRVPKKNYEEAPYRNLHRQNRRNHI